MALLRMGFSLPQPLPSARWALTPPCHPCSAGNPAERFDFCGTFLGVFLTGRYPASCPAEPGLSSHRIKRKASAWATQSAQTVAQANASRRCKASYADRLPCKSSISVHCTGPAAARRQLRFPCLSRPVPWILTIRRSVVEVFALPSTRVAWLSRATHPTVDRSPLVTAHLPRRP